MENLNPKYISSNNYDTTNNNNNMNSNNGQNIINNPLYIESPENKNPYQNNFPINPMNNLFWGTNLYQMNSSTPGHYEPPALYNQNKPSLEQHIMDIKNRQDFIRTKLSELSRQQMILEEAFKNQQILLEDLIRLIKNKNEPINNDMNNTNIMMNSGKNLNIIFVEYNSSTPTYLLSFEEEKIMDLLDKYRNIKNDKSERIFLFNERKLNPTKTCKEEGLKNNSKIYVK